MRNPIHPTADRPIPLPDCILSDGWWLTERAQPIEDGLRRLRVISGEEGKSERDRGQAEQGLFVART
jgi:hypothetical protein